MAMLETYAAEDDWTSILRARFPGYCTQVAQCPATWAGIVEGFFSLVQSLIPNPDNFKLIDIKEKYGSLRITYMIDSDNVSKDIISRIDAAASSAENESEKTCMQTGKRGFLISRNQWMMVLAEDLILPTDKILGS